MKPEGIKSSVRLAGVGISPAEGGQVAKEQVRNGFPIGRCAYTLARNFASLVLFHWDRRQGQ
jgi:hypothetical protein